jgi:hypothetical protein
MTTRGKISAGIAAIALALALILVVTGTEYANKTFLGMNHEQTGQRFGATSIILFILAFGIGFRQKSSLTTSLLIAGGGLYIAYLIIGTVTEKLFFYYATSNVFFAFLTMSCIVFGLGLLRLFKRNASSTIKAR